MDGCEIADAEFWEAQCRRRLCVAVDKLLEYAIKIRSLHQSLAAQLFLLSVSMPILRHVLVPLLIIGVVCLLFFETAKRFPFYFFGAVALLLVVAVIRTQSRRKRDDQRGWRVGHIGRDAMFYEEFRDGAWQRFEIDGEMLAGKAHHVIYFTTTRFPEWTNERRDDIIGRIKSEFHPPDYEYVGA